MKKYGFNLFWSEEDQGFIATCPDFAGLSAFGETPEEALSEAKVALDLFIESIESSDQDLPIATSLDEYSGQLRLRMPKSLHANMARMAEKEGVSLNSYIVSLLSQRNALKGVADSICNFIIFADQSIHRGDEKVGRRNRISNVWNDLVEGQDRELTNLIADRGDQIYGSKFNNEDINDFLSSLNKYMNFDKKCIKKEKERDY